MSLFPIDVCKDGIICKSVTSLRRNVWGYIDFGDTTNNTVIIPWDKELDTLPIACFQYKIGRCGSTLLSNMLEIDPVWKIIEKFPFGRIEKWHTKCSKSQDEILKRVLDCLSVKENNDQKWCYFNLMSQDLFKRNMFKRVAPSIDEFYLWRHPKEVANSLKLTPPDWYSHWNSIDEYITAVIKCVPDDMNVWYFGHVLCMLLPYWLYKKSNIELTPEKITKMKQKMKYNGKTNSTFKHDRNLNNKFSDINRKYSYNKNVIDFENIHPPHKYLYDMATSIKTLDFGKLNKKNIGATLHQSTEPYIIHNCKKLDEFTPLDGIKACGKQFPALKADNENYFIWHPKSVINSFEEKYVPASKWILTKLDRRPDRQTYIVTGAIKEYRKKFSLDFIPKPDGITSWSNPTMRISHKGARTCAHYDDTWSYSINLKGKKTVLFFSPEQTEKLCPLNNKSIMFRRVLANIAYFDPTRFPIEFDKIVKADIEPGVLLYFPPGWAHYFVTNEDATISVGWLNDNGGTKKQLVMSNPDTTLIDKITSEQYPYFHKFRIRKSVSKPSRFPLR